MKTSSKRKKRGVFVEVEFKNNVGQTVYVGLEPIQKKEIENEKL